MTLPETNNLPVKVGDLLPTWTFNWENWFYEQLEEIAMELANYPEEDTPRLVVNYLEGMSDDSKRMFLGCLANAEFFTSHTPLIRLVQKYVKSEDKRLAQAATAYLFLCCGEEGIKGIKDALKDHEIPHRELVQGMVNLLNEASGVENERE